MPAETRERVTALLESWNARDLDAFVAHLSPDVYWHDLGMPYPPAIGRAAVKSFSQSILHAFPDFTYALRGALCVAEDGLSCVAPFLVTATHTGELAPPGFAPTNRKVRLEGLDYLHLNETHITRIETRFDPFDAAEQLLGIPLRPPAHSFREYVAVKLQRTFAFWWRRTATKDRV